jgi:hypothetical protein
VTPDHRKDETAVMADIFTLSQGVDHVAHHRTLAQIFYRHCNAPLFGVRPNYTQNLRPERETIHYESSRITRSKTSRCGFPLPAFAGTSFAGMTGDGAARMTTILEQG